MKDHFAEVLHELEQQHQLKPERQAVLKNELFKHIQENKSLFKVRAPFFSFHYSYGIALAVIALILVGGTVFATENSLPGDFLHPVKLAAEQIETTLAPSEENKAAQEAEHAGERIKEVNALNTKINQTTNLQEKNKIEEQTKAAQIETQVRLQNTFKNLEQVRNDLEKRGHQEAAAEISISLEKLKSQAASSQFKINLKTDDNQKSDVQATEDDNQMPSLQLQTPTETITPSIKGLNDRKERNRDE